MLLLSDENLEKLLIWLARWRLGAVVAPLNIELNETLIADLALAVDPVLTLVHKELDGDALLAGQAVRASSATTARTRPTPIRRTISSAAMARAVEPGSLPERNAADDIACIFCTSGTTAGPRSWSTITAPIGSTGSSTLEVLGLTEDDRTLEYRSFGWNSAQVAQPHAVSGERA